MQDTEGAPGEMAARCLSRRWALFRWRRVAEAPVAAIAASVTATAASQVRRSILYDRFIAGVTTGAAEPVPTRTLAVVAIPDAATSVYAAACLAT